MLRDKDGYYVHIGKLVNKSQLEHLEEQLTEEEQLEAAEAEAWFAAMLDPNGKVEIIDAGVATGEEYVEPPEREEE